MKKRLFFSEVVNGSMLDNDNFGNVQYQEGEEVTLYGEAIMAAGDIKTLNYQLASQLDAKMMAQDEISDIELYAEAANFVSKIWDAIVKSFKAAAGWFRMLLGKITKKTEKNFKAMMETAESFIDSDELEMMAKNTVSIPETVKIAVPKAKFKTRQEVLSNGLLAIWGAGESEYKLPKEIIIGIKKADDFFTDIEAYGDAISDGGSGKGDKKSVKDIDSEITKFQKNDANGYQSGEGNKAFLYVLKAALGGAKEGSAELIAKIPGASEKDPKQKFLSNMFELETEEKKGKELMTYCEDVKEEAVHLTSTAIEDYKKVQKAVAKGEEYFTKRTQEFEEIAKKLAKEVKTYDGEKDENKADAANAAGLISKSVSDISKVASWLNTQFVSFAAFADMYTSKYTAEVIREIKVATEIAKKAVKV